MSPTHLLAGAAALAFSAMPAVAQHAMPAMEHQHHDIPSAPAQPTPPAPAPVLPTTQTGHDQIDHNAHAGHTGHGMPANTGDQPGGEYVGPNLRYLSGCTSVALVGEDSNIDGTACRPGGGSGTSRVPANDGGMHGLHLPIGGGWMAMLHGYVTEIYTDQTGPRGDDKRYAQSMAMLTLSRETSWGRVQARTMLSLEPLLRHDGYPNLFATGEIAYGEPLVDRQHPHDLFMELSARVDVNAGAGSVFLYGGPVGEPAIGPSAFMMRRSATYNPEAPIAHHWLDSTHITYGVVTAGYTSPHWQIEASAFRGREPDEFRWNIETPQLDSWAVRATWTPSAHWSLQASTARLREPEANHPGEDEQRTTATVQYADGQVSALVAYALKDRLPGGALPAWLAEANWNITDRHTLFGRVEHVANDELFPDHDDPLHDQTFRVTKFQAGYAYRLPVGPFGLALGGTIAAFAKPSALDATYGANPMGYTLFARLSLGH